MLLDLYCKKYKNCCKSLAPSRHGKQSPSNAKPGTGALINFAFNALEKNNENTGGAYIDRKPNAYFIRGVGLVKTEKSPMENVSIKNSLYFSQNL